MKKIIRKIFGYRKINCIIHTGMGYIQGTGINVNIERTYILGFSFISDITIKSDLEWTTSLKEKLSKIK